MSEPSRDGAKQPERFDPARAARLDDPARFAYLAPAALIALLDLRAGATLVDFGAGTGTYAFEIARSRPDVSIFALDEQVEMLEKLRAKLEALPSANIEPLGPERLTELHGRIDRILALNVLHELGDDALADLAALLAPTGRALIVDWNADVERPLGPPRDHVYGVSDARQRLESRGFHVLSVTLFAYHYAFLIQARA